MIALAASRIASATSGAAFSRVSGPEAASPSSLRARGLAAPQVTEEAAPRVERLDVDVVEAHVAARPVLVGGFERAVRIAWAMALHVGVPTLITWLPTTTGMRLRDFADFNLEQAAAGGACAALLVASGLAKLCGSKGNGLIWHR